MGDYIKNNPTIISRVFTPLFKNHFTFRKITDREVFFLKDGVTIFVSEEKYEDGIQVNISFDENIIEKDLFNLGWIYRVDKNKNPFLGKTIEEQLEVLVDYYCENMSNLNDISFCQKMREVYNAEIMRTL